MHAGGQHLDQRRLVGGDLGGQRVQQGLRDGDVFREAAVEVAAEQPAAAAQLRQVPAALPAHAAERGRVHHDRGPGRRLSSLPGNLRPSGYIVRPDRAVNPRLAAWARRWPPHASPGVSAAVTRC